MTSFIYERDYAREMLSAAIRSQAGGRQPGGTEPDCADDITALIQEALDAGCGTTKLIIELANLSARLVIPPTPRRPLTLTGPAATEGGTPLVW